MSEPAEQAVISHRRLQLAGTVAKRIQVHNVRLLESSVQREIVRDSEIPDSVHLTYGFKAEHCFDPDAKRLDVLVRFVVGGKGGEEETSLNIFRI